MAELVGASLVDQKYRHGYFQEQAFKIIAQQQFSDSGAALGSDDEVLGFGVGDVIDQRSHGIGVMTRTELQDRSRRQPGSEIPAAQ